MITVVTNITAKPMINPVLLEPSTLGDAVRW